MFSNKNVVKFRGLEEKTITSSPFTISGFCSINISVIKDGTLMGTLMAKYSTCFNT